jgi:hypothetical protein
MKEMFNKKHSNIENSPQSRRLGLRSNEGMAGLPVGRGQTGGSLQAKKLMRDDRGRFATGGHVTERVSHHRKKHHGEHCEDHMMHHTKRKHHSMGHLVEPDRSEEFRMHSPLPRSNHRAMGGHVSERHHMGERVTGRRSHHAMGGNIDGYSMVDMMPKRRTRLAMGGQADEKNYERMDAPMPRRSSRMMESNRSEAFETMPRRSEHMGYHHPREIEPRTRMPRRSPMMDHHLPEPDRSEEFAMHERLPMGEHHKRGGRTGVRKSPARKTTDRKMMAHKEHHEHRMAMERACHGGREMAKGGKWIQGMHMEKGALHREMHVPEGKKIPASRLKKAEHSANPTLRKRAVLAETLKSFHSRKK